VKGIGRANQNPGEQPKGWAKPDPSRDVPAPTKQGNGEAKETEDKGEAGHQFHNE